MDISQIINRVIEVITNPKNALKKLKDEKVSNKDILFYLAIVAFPTFLGVFIGYGFIGFGWIGGVGALALVLAIIEYILSIIGVVVFAYILNALASNFKSNPDLMQSMKLVAAAATPWLVAGIISIYPPAALVSQLGGL